MPTARVIEHNQSKRVQKGDLLKRIQSEVVDTFGKQVSSSGDCIELSDEIFKHTSRRINPNTLRRIFGLVKNHYLPSFNTLNILAQYCGFENLEELEHKETIEEFNDDGADSKQFLWYLISLFRHVPAKEYNDETFLALAKRTILFLQKHPRMADKFQRVIARTKNGQDFYFEQFVNIDGLNSFYGKGLLFYLNEKKTTEAQIFGHSLLCVKGYLSDDVQYVKRHHDEVMKFRLNKAIHPFVCGRYFATQIFHADIFGLDPEPILINAHQMHSGIKPGKDNYRSFPGFEYVLSLALLLARRYDEVLYFIDYGRKTYTNRHSYVEEGFYQTIDLMEAFALQRTGELAKSKAIFRKLQPGEFYFLTKRINTILYLKLKKELKGLTAVEESQMEEMICRTRFSRMKKF